MASCRVFDQDDEIADPLGLSVVTTLVKWNLKADAKKDVCSSLAPLGVSLLLSNIVQVPSREMGMLELRSRIL